MTERSRLLIVDDETREAFSMWYGLRQLPNCEIEIAPNGHKALHLFEQQPFDVLITDYQMPDMNGVTLATRIRQLYPQTSVIMVTDHDENVSGEQAARASIQHVLGKPVWPSAICALVSSVLLDA
ncbi:MAG: response regulator [Chloroflexi bacterium]|nr:response regulator [Chloroflexota bacterium]